ncbi:MAG: phosphate/phosphite/phosphonate ABC transporter substrate-binding protein [Gemmataceae bacterium]|nr:phosphate/phosphite/phosphonate ABC transporter substrate-binding protein [Gemmataceae bacterium]
MVLFLAAAVPAVALVPAAPAQDPPVAPPTVIRLGLLTGMFRDVSPDLIQAASVPFRDQFKRATGLDAGVELVDDYRTLAAKLNDKKLQFGVFHGYEYAWARDQYPDLLPLVVSVPTGGKVQACLVVNAASKAEKPADLKGNCVTVPIGTKSHCHLYLERLQAELPPNTCGPSGPRELGPEEALDNVCANKCPAALVDIGSLTAFQNNKPGAAASLKVLDRSELFPAGVVVYRKDAIDPQVVEKVRKSLVDVRSNPQGRAFLMLWRLQGFTVPADGYYTDLERIKKAFPAPPAVTTQSPENNP